MGIGIWAMHYIGMEAFRLPIPVMYDWPTVLLSLFAAILASGVALFTVSRPIVTRRSMIVGGILMGGGIAAMHYIGMEAMRIPAMCMYKPWLVGVSIVLAIAISFAALQQAFLFREKRTSGGWRKIRSALLLGLAIPTMHYVGMAAAYFIPRSSITDHDSVSVTNIGLACIVLGALATLALALISSSVNRRSHELSQQAAEHQLQLQAMFDTMTEAIVVVDCERGITEHNRAACELFGLQNPIVQIHQIAENFEGFSIAGAPLEQNEWPLARAIHGDYCTNEELIIRRKDTGTDVTVETSTVPVATQDGSTKIIMSFRDITERKRAATAQKESEHLYHSLFSSMKEGFCVIEMIYNPDGKPVDYRFIEVNPAFERQSGLKGAVGKRMRDFAPSLESYWVDLFGGVALTGEPAHLVEEAKAINGYFDVHAYRIGEAKLRRVAVIFTEISERKRMDEARNRLAAIVESSEDAIIGKSDAGIVTSWNDGAERLFGYTAAEMVGCSIHKLLPADRQHEEEEILRRIKQGETVNHFETVRTRKDGALVQVSLTISPIKDSNGKIIGASKIARNITEKKQMERQLQQSQKMEAVGQLTGGIAHDFNNLLAVISGNLELLERLVRENEAARKRVQTAQKAAARGADLTRRLLAFSSNVELKPAPTKLALCIGNAMELARAVGPEIQIVTSLDDSVPLVLVDAAGLESALLNLAVNARDAMPKGGTLTIATELITLEENYPPVKTGELKSGRYARVSVSDTGHGMSKETLGHVFEPFFTTKPRGKGTGLGLAMVYGFAKQSGGIVRIYSEPGYGTTVSLYLPLAEDIPVSGSHRDAELFHPSS